MTNNFLDKHPKFAAFIGKAGDVLAPILQVAGNIPGLQLLGNIGNAIDAIPDLSPDQKQMAKEILKFEMAELNELDGMIFADRKNARETNLQMQVSETPGWLAKNVAYCIDIMLALVWGSLTIYIAGKFMNLVTDGSNMTSVLSLYATVTAVFSVVVQYHRGSSISSRSKDEQINRMINKS